jgi:hypothetical protein
VREEMEKEPEKRTWAIQSIHVAGNRKQKKSDLNYEIILF